MTRRQTEVPINKLTISIAFKLQYIYRTLTKLGCNLIPTSQSQFQQNSTLYLQDTESRMQLLEWLIGAIYPGYDLDSQFRNTFDDDPHIHKIKRINVVLWQLGVMPMSKHTKNLDYVKYTQGLLGAESSLNLIFDLTELAASKFSPKITEIQKNSAALLGQLIKFHRELVNVNYDPYGVTFPSKHYQNIEDSRKVDELYNNLKDKYSESKIGDEKQRENSSIDLLDDVEGYKDLLKHKYQKLMIKVQNTITKFGSLVPTADSKEIKQLHQKRMLKINRSLCQNYSRYNDLLNKLKTQQVSGDSLKQLKNQTLTFLNNINNVHIIFE